jgi:hypothetical protein
MDLTNIDLLNNDTLVIKNEDGTISFISEGIATENEKTIFEEFRRIYPNGEIIEVSLEDAQNSKITEMSRECESKIIYEFYSDCLGDKKQFDCTITDQTNIMGLVAKAQMILAGLATDDILDWKATGEPACYPWTPQQAIKLGQDLFFHKTEKIKRYEALRTFIKEQTDVNIVQLIAWETKIEN